MVDADLGEGSPLASARGGGSVDPGRSRVVETRPVALGVTMKMTTRGMVPVLAVAAGLAVTPAAFNQNPGILYMCSLS